MMICFFGHARKNQSLSETRFERNFEPKHNDITTVVLLPLLELLSEREISKKESLKVTIRPFKPSKLSRPGLPRDGRWGGARGRDYKRGIRKLCSKGGGV